MAKKTIFKKTCLFTLLVFLVFVIAYLLIWWLAFNKRSYPISEAFGFNFPFLISRWYDFGLICLWPLIITPLAYLGIKEEWVVLGTIGMICSFFFIGLPLAYWEKGIFKGGYIMAIVFITIGWISTEIFFFTLGTKNYERLEIITDSLKTNLFAGLGVALAFLFTKGLLIGLMAGFAVTLTLSLMIVTYNLLFKSIVREIVSPSKI